MKLKALTSLFFTLFLISACYAVPPKLNPVPSDFYTGITWDDAHKFEKPIVVNFYVDWCGACKRFAPNFDKLRKEFENKYSFVIVKTDDPKNINIVGQFPITSYPSVFIVDTKNNKKIFLEQRKYLKHDEMCEELNNFLEQ